MASLSEIIQGLQERYEGFLEGLREREIPHPEILVPGIAVVLIAAIAFIALYTFTPSSNAITVSVYSPNGDPVAAARITLLNADTNIVLGTAVSAADGTARIDNVAPNVPFKVRVVAANYKSSEQTLTAGTKAATMVLEAEAQAPKTTSVGIQLKDAQGNGVEGATVQLLFDDGTPMQQPSNSLGMAQFDLTQVPSHATVVVKKDGFEDKLADFSGTDLERNVTIISLTSKNDKSQASLQSTDLGLLLVRVTTKTRAPISGAIVTLMDAGTGEALRPSRTGQDGVAAFSELPLGKKIFIVVNDPDKRYLDAKFDQFEFTADTLPIVIRLDTVSAGNQGEMSVTALDGSGTPLKDAEVRFYERKTNTMLFAPLNTDDKGEVHVQVATGITFYATVFKAGFLPGMAETLSSGSSSRITLQAETPDNAVDANVTVTEDDAAVVGAQVTAQRSDGTALGIPPATTGPDGTAKVRVPRKIADSEYRLQFSASKEHSTGKSDVLSSRPPINAKVKLTAAKANLDVSVKDMLSEQRLPGVTINAVIGSENVGSCVTNAAGLCSLKLPPKELTLIASAPGYLQATSAPLTLLPSSANSHAILMYPGALARAAYARFDGLYSSKGRMVEVGNGERYRARFFVTLPPASTDAGFYLRVGKRSSASGDIAGIVGFDAVGKGSVYSSTTYSPDTDCLNDTPTDNSSAPLKWIEVRFPKGFTGTREISVDLQVPRELPAGEGELQFSYRAYAQQKGVPIVYPTDAALVDKLTAKRANGEAITPGDFCTAATTTSKVPVTTSPLVCDDAGVCTRSLFEDPTTGTRTSENFQATLGQEFLLHFDVLPTADITSIGFRSDTIKIQSVQRVSVGFAPATTVSFQSSTQPSPTPTGIGNQLEEQAFSFNAKANVKSSIVVHASPLQLTRHAQFDVILHSPTADPNTDTVSLSLAVSGKDRLKVSATPTTVAALAEQRLTLKVLNAVNDPLTDAQVELYSCSGNPLPEPVSIEGTNEAGVGLEGNYQFKLTAQGPGSLCARVRREGYRAADLPIARVTSQDFLEVSPDSARLDDSNRGQPLRFTVHNALDSRVRVSGAILCDGAPSSMLSVQPSSLQVAAGADASFDVSLVQNVTANGACRVHFSSRVGLDNVAEADASLLLSITGPAALPTGKPLPSPLYIYLDDSTGFNEIYAATYQGQRITGADLQATGQLPSMVLFNLDSTGGVLAVTGSYDPNLFGGYGLNGAQMQSQYSYSYTQGYGYPQSGAPQYYGGAPQYIQPYGGPQYYNPLSGVGLQGGISPYGAGVNPYAYGGFQNTPMVPGYGMPSFPMRGNLRLTLADGKTAVVMVVVQSRPFFGVQTAQFGSQQTSILPSTIRFTVKKTRGGFFQGTAEVTHLALPMGYLAPAGDLLISGPVSLGSVQQYQPYGQYQGQYRAPTDYYSDVSYTIDTREDAGKVVLTASFSNIRGDDPRSRIAGLHGYMRVALKTDPSTSYLVPIAFNDIIPSDGIVFTSPIKSLSLTPGQEKPWVLTLKHDDDTPAANVQLDFEVTNPELATVRSSGGSSKEASSYGSATTDSNGIARILIKGVAAGALKVTATALGEKNQPSAPLDVKVEGTGTQGSGTTPSGIKAELSKDIPECPVGKPCQLSFIFTRSGQPLANAQVKLTIDDSSPLSFYTTPTTTSKSLTQPTDSSGIARFDVGIPDANYASDDVSLDVFNFQILPGPAKGSEGLVVTNAAAPRTLFLQDTGRVNVPDGARIGGAPRMKVKKAAVSGLEFDRSSCNGNVKGSGTEWTCTLNYEFVSFKVNAKGFDAKGKSLEFRTHGVLFNAYTPTGAQVYSPRVTIPFTGLASLSATTYASIPASSPLADVTVRVVDANGQPVTDVPESQLRITRTGGAPGIVGGASATQMFDTPNGIKLSSTVLDEPATVNVRASIQKVVDSHTGAKILVFALPFDKAGVTEGNWLGSASLAANNPNLKPGDAFGDLTYLCTNQQNFGAGPIDLACDSSPLSAKDYAVLVLAYGLTGNEPDWLTPAVRYAKGSDGNPQKVTVRLTASSFASKVQPTVDEAKGVLKGADGLPVFFAKVKGAQLTLKLSDDLTACKYAASDIYGGLTQTSSGFTVFEFKPTGFLIGDEADRPTRVQLVFTAANDAPATCLRRATYPVKIKYIKPDTSKAAALACAGGSLNPNDWQKVAANGDDITDEQFVCLKASQAFDVRPGTPGVKLVSLTDSLAVFNAFASSSSYPFAKGSALSAWSKTDCPNFIFEEKVGDYARLSISKWRECDPMSVTSSATAPMQLPKNQPLTFSYKRQPFRAIYDGKTVSYIDFGGAATLLVTGVPGVRANSIICDENNAYVQLYPVETSGAASVTVAPSVLTEAQLKQLYCPQALKATERPANPLTGQPPIQPGDKVSTGLSATVLADMVRGATGRESTFDSEIQYKEAGVTITDTNLRTKIKLNDPEVQVSCSPDTDAKKCSVYINCLNKFSTDAAKSVLYNVDVYDNKEDSVLTLNGVRYTLAQYKSANGKKWARVKVSSQSISTGVYSTLTNGLDVTDGSPDSGYTYLDTNQIAYISESNDACVLLDYTSIHTYEKKYVDEFTGSNKISDECRAGTNLETFYRKANGRLFKIQLGLTVGKTSVVDGMTVCDVS